MNISPKQKSIIKLLQSGGWMENWNFAESNTQFISIGLRTFRFLRDNEIITQELSPPFYWKLTEKGKQLEL